MPKKKIIQLPKPCSSKWDEMNAHQQGKFCDSCQKAVIDLTTKSDQEILRLYKLNNGKMCGRVNSNQLNRPMDVREEQSMFSTKLSKAAASVALFSILQNDVNGQDSIPESTEMIDSLSIQQTNEVDTTSVIEAQTENDTVKLISEVQDVNLKDPELITRFIVTETVGIVFVQPLNEFELFGDICISEDYKTAVVNDSLNAENDTVLSATSLSDEQPHPEQPKESQINLPIGDLIDDRKRIRIESSSN